MEKKDYSEMTTAELIAENQKLSEDRQAIRVLQLEINAVLSQRARSEEFEAELKRMKDKFGQETQIVGVAGIASKQEVGTPS